MIPIVPEAAIPVFVAADPTLAGLIGARLYYGSLPEGLDLSAGPAAVFYRVSTERDHGTDKRTVRFQFTAWASSPPAAGAVEAAIEDAFIRFKGNLGGLIVHQCVIEASYDLPPETGPERYGRACDIRIIYRSEE